MSVNSDSKVSQTSANPEAATHIYRHADAIVEAWTRMVRNHCDDARASMDTDYLQNSLPTLLRHLADALEDPHWNYDKQRASSLSAEHGRQRRISSEYTVEMMLDEYAILRKVICRSLERQPPWPDALLARVHAFIDASLCALPHASYFPGAFATWRRRGQSNATAPHASAGPRSSSYKSPRNKRRRQSNGRRTLRLSLSRHSTSGTSAEAMSQRYWRKAKCASGSSPF